MPKRVAIIGGGPGGLIAAYQLERKAGGKCSITLFEACDRLGGKVITGQFHSAPVSYEAGVAELYDYSHLGCDPLREVIAELGLPVRQLRSETVVIGDHIIRSRADIRRRLGRAAENELARFDASARKVISPAEYFDCKSRTDGAESSRQRNFADHLCEISDSSARHYVETIIHSDLATEPHLTNIEYGLQNYLVNDPDYTRLYTIEGGIERLPRALAARIDADIRLRSRVTQVERVFDGSYRVGWRHDGENSFADFDYVIAALPNNWLPLIRWEGKALSEAMHRHHVFHDYPAHYLRVSVLFSRPFWRDEISDSYFSSDALGGCCIYDETPRGPDQPGILAWLLAGEAAMAMSSLDDASLVDAVLDTLPSSLRHGRQYYLEGRVHRWIGAVNGMPGGGAARSLMVRHQPEPLRHPALFVVGDYLFDSTINGAFDSANIVVGRIVEQLSMPASGPAREVAPRNAPGLAASP